MNAGAPRAAVERALEDQDLFVAAVMEDVEKDAGGATDPLATAAAVNGPE